MKLDGRAKELMDIILELRKIKHHSYYLEKLSMPEMAVFCTMINLVKNDETLSDHLVQMGDISRHAYMSKPATSQIINKLENRGFIERVSPKEDRRAVYVRFTEKGLTICKTEMNYATTFINAVVDQMGADNMKNFLGLFKQFLIISNEISEEMRRKDKQ